MMVARPSGRKRSRWGRSLLDPNRTWKSRFAERQRGMSEPESFRSIGLDARDLHYLVPFFEFGGDVSPELCGTKHHGNGADVGEPSLDLRLRQPFIDHAVESLDDLGRSPSRHADPSPRVGLVARQCLGNGRYIRQQIKSLAAQDAKRAQPAAADLWQRRHHHVEADVDLAADQ